MRFIPISFDPQHMFTVFIGNNGVGKSAVLEALDAALNNRRVLRTLKVAGKRVEHLSSGEQRKAVIDVAYSTLIANGEREQRGRLSLANGGTKNDNHRNRRGRIYRK